jgi:phosphoribosylformylglycinamidine synthase PurS subunit
VSLIRKELQSKVLYTQWDTLVRIGKRLEVTLDATSRAEAEEMVAAMSEKLFANPVIENFQFDLEEV